MRREAMCKALAIAFVLVLGAACGSNAASGGTPTPTPSSGSDDPNGLFVIAPIDNNTTLTPPAGPQVANFTVADMMSFQYPVFQGIAGISATIVLNSTANGCSDANVNGFHVGETQVVINITDLPDTTIAANTYIFPAAADDPYEIASATYATVQAPCSYNSTSLVSGKVVVSNVQPGSLSGTYDLTFAAGSISGAFDTAPQCAAVGTTPATAPACN